MIGIAPTWVLVEILHASAAAPFVRNSPKAVRVIVARICACRKTAYLTSTLSV